MSDIVSDGLALPDANGITKVHANGDQEIRGTSRTVQPDINNRQSKNNYTPTLQTLKNFLTTCHTLNQATKAFLDTPPQQQDAPFPSLQGKVYPRKVVKSLNFMEKQMEVWQLLLKDTKSSLQQTVFPSAEQVHDKFFVVETVDGEKRLCPFDRLGVSATVLTLVRQVLSDQALSEAAGIGGNIVYSSAGARSSLGVPAEPQYHGDPCEDERYRGLSIFSNTNNDRPLPVVVIEYRPKDFSLDSSMIAALENGVVPTQGINDDDSSPAGVITAMITQVFNYMVKSGVMYGYLYSVEGIVFLEIQEDPSVVHYSVSLPRDEVDYHVESTMPYSAVSQIFAFIIRAMRAKSSSMAWSDEPDELAAWKNEVVSNIDEIAMQLQHWGKPSASSAPCDRDQENMDTDADSDGKEFDGESYHMCDVDIDEETSMTVEIRMDADFMEEDMLAASTLVHEQDQMQDQMQVLTLRDEQFVRNDGEEDKENQSENAQESMQANDDHDDEMHEDEDVDVDNNNNGGWIENDHISHFNNKKGEDMYCSQQCLLGVANGLPMDKACPNFRFHRNKHISKEEFLARVRDQLIRHKQANPFCFPLDLWGSIGTLFKVTLVGYGYTFVAKATLRADWVSLHREDEMYGKLKDLQGSCIPVCLGIVRVDPEFWHEHRLLSQFMLLSWGGQSVYGDFKQHFDEKEKNLFGDSVFKAYGELHRAGMQHRDIDLSNMLYNPRLGRIMLIDFHGSRFLPDNLAGFDADGNDMAKQSEDNDDGVPYEADGSVRSNSTSGNRSRNACPSETPSCVDKFDLMEYFVCGCPQGQRI
ncbi:hypothetical protein GGI43DRAFT_181162 [Trichoderma evansii]